MYPFDKLEKSLLELREAREAGRISPAAVYWVEEFIHSFGPLRAFGKDQKTLGQVMAETYAAWRVSELAAGRADPGPYEAPPNLDGQ